jgi:hypothetical protein
VIDDEQLVNRGGHPALSEGFEILSWFSGDVKHAFLAGGDGGKLKSHSKENQSISQGRKRMLFLVGKLLQLGHTLRALAKAEDPPVDAGGELLRVAGDQLGFGVQHASAARDRMSEIEEIQSLVPIPEYAAALAAASTLRFQTGEQAEMRSIGAEILRLAKRLDERADGSTFESLDPLLPEDRR